ncbi:hypothetical protein [Silanimonas sp.]|jgi:hypothetical protein|uniref:hypothetical protein n=1 Tax=Silanimonas sp. TaxID=1929290 RepID=UPI0037C68CBA
MATGQRPPIGPSAFAPHGAVDQASPPVAGSRVVYIDATGPFNREMVDQIREIHTTTFRDAAAQGPFGHITTFHASMLATPDAFTAFAALLAEWMSMGIIPTASAYVVGPEVEGKTIVETHYRRAREGACFEIFERRDEAEAWIARMLAEAS